MPNKFNEMGSQLIQIGLYFTTKDTEDFESSELYNNITNYLIQSYLYLLSYNKELETADTSVNQIEAVNEVVSQEKFLTKKEVIQIYHPLLTEYGLTQAIHKQEIPYQKRGAKYFFKPSEIDEWIANNSSKQSQTKEKNYQYV